MATVVCVTDGNGCQGMADEIMLVDPREGRLLRVPHDLWCATVDERIGTAFSVGGHEALVAALTEHGLAAQHSVCLARAAVEGALAEAGRAVVDVYRLLAPDFPFDRVLAGPGCLRASSEAALAEVAAVRPEWRLERFADVIAAKINGRDVSLYRRRSALGRRLSESVIAAWLAATAAGRALSRVGRALYFRRRRFLRWLLIKKLVLPSEGWLPRPRRVRLLAMLAVRNDAPYLAGYLANVGPHVDGIVALDDGSSDGSGDLLASDPRVLEVLRVTAGRPRWEQVANFRALHASALRQGAEWLLSLDADERVERRFRERAERVIRRGNRFGIRAYSVRFRELWGSPATYRCDGLWGRKRQARLFAALPDHQFDFRPLHAHKAPLQARVLGGFIAADLEVYHLRTIRREDREARRDRNKTLDPSARWQPGVGYDYLTDECRLRVRRVGERRGFEE